MLSELLKKPILFELLSDTLTTNELNYILDQKDCLFVVQKIPPEYINLEDMPMNLFETFLSVSNSYLIYLQKIEMLTSELFKEKIKLITNIDLLYKVFYFTNKLNIEDFFDIEFIKKNHKLIQFVKNLNIYIDFIIENKILLSYSNMKKLNDENLIKLLNSNICNSNLTITNWLYELLIKKEKQLVIDHMVNNKTFSSLFPLRYFSNIELKTLFNSNPKEDIYHQICNFNSIIDRNINNIFDNPIVFKYDINTIIYYDKNFIKDNYEYIKNIILNEGCGKANLKRFLNINKDNLSQDIIDYGLLKINLYTCNLLNIPLNKTKIEKKEKKFLDNNLDLNIDINKTYLLNNYSKSILKEKIKKIRNI